MTEKYVYLILGVILGAAIVIYWWANREEKIESEIKMNQKVFSTSKLDTTMETIVNKIKLKISEVKRELTEDEKKMKLLKIAYKIIYQVNNNLK